MPKLVIRFLVYQASYRKLKKLKKILLIDDDRDISELIKTVLADQYQVEIQSDHHGISDKMTSFAPDLVLLDNRVGHKQAADIIPQLKPEGEQNLVPIVLFSAHHNIAGIAGEIQADAYIAKPLDLDELYTCLHRLTA